MVSGNTQDRQEDGLVQPVIVYERQGTGIVIEWLGRVSGDGIKKVQEDIYAEERIHKLRYQIWDFTKADELSISLQDLRDIALQDKLAAQINPDQIVAIVGDKDFFSGYDLIFHIHEEVWSGFKSKTFATVAEARSWISTVVK